MHVIDADLRGDDVRGGALVPGQHGQTLHTHATQLVQGLLGIGARHVLEHDACRQFAVNRHIGSHLVGSELAEHLRHGELARGQGRCLGLLTPARGVNGGPETAGIRRTTARRVRCRRGLSRSRSILRRGDEGEPSHADPMPVDLAADTVARVLGHAADHGVAARIHQPFVLRRQRFTVRGAFLEPVHNGRAARGDALGQDMHRIRFHNAGVHQDMVGVQPRIRPAPGLRGGRRTLRGRRHHVGRFRAGDLHAHDLRFLDGQRAGFVEEHMRDAAEVLQHLLRFDDDTGLGEPSGAGDVRHRRRDQQRAWGGEHEHLRESGRVGGHDPRGAGDDEGDHRERHGHQVGGFDHGGARFLRGRDEFDDALVLRIAGELGGAHGQRGRTVDGAGHHARTGEHLARHRFAVDVAQVQRGRAAEQFAVDGHSFAGQYDEHVAQPHLVHGHGTVRGVGNIRTGVPRRPRVRFRSVGGHHPIDAGHRPRIVVGSGRGMRAGTHPRQVGDVRDLRRGLHQRGQVVLGLVLGVRLDGGTGEHHQYHNPAGPVFLHRQRGQQRNHRQDVDADVTVADVVDHAAQRVDDGIGDQHDHDPLTDARIDEPERLIPWTEIPQQGNGQSRHNHDRQHGNELAHVEYPVQHSDEYLHRLSLRRYRPYGRSAQPVLDSRLVSPSTT